MDWLLFCLDNTGVALERFDDSSFSTDSMSPSTSLTTWGSTSAMIEIEPAYVRTESIKGMLEGFTQKPIRDIFAPQILTGVRGPGRFEMQSVCLRCVRLIFHCNAAGPKRKTSTCCMRKMSQGAGDILRKSM
jgi:hypothetical protein